MAWIFSRPISFSKIFSKFFYWILIWGWALARSRQDSFSKIYWFADMDWFFNGGRSFSKIFSKLFYWILIWGCSIISLFLFFFAPQHVSITKKWKIKSRLQKGIHYFIFVCFILGQTKNWKNIEFPIVILIFFQNCLPKKWKKNEKCCFSLL